MVAHLPFQTLRLSDTVTFLVGALLLVFIFAVFTVLFFVRVVSWGDVGGHARRNVKKIICFNLFWYP
jgi:hypothetical protein